MRCHRRHFLAALAVLLTWEPSQAAALELDREGGSEGAPTHRAGNVAEGGEGADSGSEAGSEAGFEAGSEAAGVVARTARDGEAWRLGGVATVRYTQPLILDVDPRNDLSLRYGLKAALTMPLTMPGSVQAFVAGDLGQTFWAEVGDSAFRLHDVQIGAVVSHDLNRVVAGRDITLSHQATLFMPASRSTRANGGLLAASWLSSATYAPLDGLEMGLAVNATWSWFRYAEQRGLHGGMNDRFMIDMRPSAQYTLFDSADYGSLTVGADVFVGSGVKYASREHYQAAASDTTYWRPSYGWDAFVSYAPLDALALAVSIEHSGPVRDDGVINVYFIKREDTMLSVALRATY